MKNSAREVVDKMFVAFASGDVEKFADTVSEDTVWIYHGTQIIPAGVFEKKEGVRTFFTNIMERTEIILFEPQ
jgi:ketosteroid isomerase-like protein